MKDDKSKRMVLAMLCLYLAIGIVALLIYMAFGSHFSKNAYKIDYTFSDKGDIGNPVEISTVEVIGESGAKDEEESLAEANAEVESATEESVQEDTASESSEKHFYSFVVSTKETRLRIRQEPSEDAKILGHFAKSKTGYVLIKGNEWSYVTDGKKNGYCSNEYLDLTEISVDELPDFYPEEYKTVSDEEIDY